MSGPASTAAVSLRAFAREVGVNEKVIRRLVARGVLPIDDGGQILLAAGLRAYAAVRPLATQSVRPEKATPSDAETPAEAPALGGRAEAELERIRWQARLAELKARRESGELVERAAVKKDASDTCSAIRTALLALPPRLARLIEGLCAGGPPRVSEIQQVLEDEVNAVLEHLHASRFTGSDDLA